MKTVYRVKDRLEVRIDRTLKIKLKTFAEREGRTVSSIVNSALKQYVCLEELNTR